MISSVITIVLTAIILRYVLELEQKQCPCSLTWQHRFIKTFAPIVLVVALLTLLVSPNVLMGAIKSNPALGVLYMLYLTFAIFYGITLVLYFLKLRYSLCRCSRDWKQYGLLYPIISFAIVLLLLIIVNAIVVFGLLPKMVEKITGKKTAKGASPKELVNTLSNSVKNTSRRGRK
jgi:hypothetical protein